MSKDEDIKLINEFKEGSKAAFDKLANKYKNMIFNLCYKILNNYEDAEESAQDTFVKVFRNINSFNFGSAFSTWLYVIAVNTCKNKLKSAEYRFKKLIINFNTSGKNDFENNSIDNKSSPLDNIIQNETEELILNTIKKLPDDYKILVVLRDLEDKSYEEIEKITGLKSGTVKSKLFRAREILKKSLKEAL